MKKIAILAVVALAVSLVLTGCGSGKPDVEAQRAACTQNMMLISTEMKLFLADTGEYPPFDTVLQKIGRTCPSKGVYSFDPSTDTLSCSAHGAYAAK